MIEKIEEYFEGVRGTAISGVFLLLSLFLPKIFNIEMPIWLDPTWISVIISGVPLMRSAIRKMIKNKGISKISSAMLVSVAMISAIIIGDLFAAGEVAFIMAIGEILEDKTTERAKKGLKGLIKLQPVQARLITGETVSVEQIQVGDLIRILPGETISVDGVIVKGETSIDQSVMTGESLHVDKTVGDSVFGGTVNRYGSIDIRATRVGKDSSLQKLIRIVKEAEDKQAPMQRIADNWASWLVPLAMIIAIIAGIISKSVTVAVTVLVVFCPCALVLATPTAIMAAIGQATKHGIIIKSGDALEKMGKIDTIAFDKTGTLTYGKLQVSEVISLDSEISEYDLLLITASAESKSEHPLGKAIVQFAKEKGLKVLESEKFNMEAGKGITATLSGAEVYCGNERFIKEKGLALPLDKIINLRSEGKAVIITASRDKVIGVIALSDTVKSNAKTVIDSLKDMQVDSVILTGDNENTARYFAKQLNITQVYSGLLPEEKVNSIVNLRHQGKKVCMVGDGINDAPALKIADVGIAMGTLGSDIAIDSADIALVGDDISKLPYLKRLSMATVNTIKFSISLSLFINLVAIILSVMNVLTPTTGALVHNAGSCFVVLIAALLYDRKFD